MRKTNLMIIHPEVTSKSLADFTSGRGPIRMGLRIAVLQGVMDKAPIDQLSRRHNLSRQGIYDLVNRVNEKGFPGIEEGKRHGRPSGLTTELSDELKEILLQPPTSQGYNQSRWDGPLIGTYLKEKHGIDIKHCQVNNWAHSIGFSLQRCRQKYSKADPAKQEEFVETLKKTPE